MDFLKDRLSSYFAWGLSNFVDMFSLPKDIATGGFKVVLSAVSKCIYVLLSWFYNLIFVELYDSCSEYGYKLLNFLFSRFSSNSFSFEAIEFVVGFIFVVFVLKLTINIVRG